MKTAVITGANGFVGFALLRELIGCDYKVVSIIRESSVDAFSTKICKLDNNDNVVIVKSDLSDMDSLFSELNELNLSYDVFYHFAWKGSSGHERGDYELQKTNVDICTNMVKLAKNIGCKTFVGAGSIMEDEVMKMVYANNQNSTINYIYSASKLNAHLQASIIAKSIGIDFIWGKITNIYGVNDTTNRFVNNTLCKMLSNEVCNFSKSDQIYDFIYIEDAARAFRLIGENGTDGVTYTIGSSNITSLKEKIEIMALLTNTQSTINFGAFSSGVCYLDRECFDTSSLAEVGFTPAYTFEEGIKRTIEYIKDTENT